MPEAEKVDKIEIYSDGCYLQPSAANPKASVGWAALIVKHIGSRREVKQIHGGYTDGAESSVIAETYAAWRGLEELSKEYDPREISQFPSIILKTDHESMVSTLRKLATNLNRDAERVESSFGTEMQELSALMRGMDAKAEYTQGSHRKIRAHSLADEDYPTIANGLAKKEAYLARLSSQGYISIEGRRYEREAALTPIERFCSVAQGYGLK